MEEMHKNILEHVLRGCVSDPPDMTMYYFCKTRADGLPWYRGVRGTSQLESFHFHVARSVPTWCMSPEFMDVTMLEFVWEWNCNAAINNLGSRDYGFYNLEVLDELVRLPHNSAIPKLRTEV